MHGTGDVKLGAALVAELLGQEGFGDDTDDFTSGGKGGIGDDAHEADISTAIDDADALGDEVPGKTGGGGWKVWIEPAAGSAVDGDAAHDGFLRQGTGGCKGAVF